MASSGRTIHKTPVVGVCSGSLTLSTTPTNITGCSVSLTPGWWSVEGVFDWNGAAVDDTDQVFLGSLATSGGTASVSNSSSQATFKNTPAASRGTSSQTWLVNVTATTTATLQGAKSGGTGSSTAGTTHSLLKAIWVGPS